MNELPRATLAMEVCFLLGSIDGHFADSPSQIRRSQSRAAARPVHNRVLECANDPLRSLESDDGKAVSKEL